MLSNETRLSRYHLQWSILRKRHTGEQKPQSFAISVDRRAVTTMIIEWNETRTHKEIERARESAKEKRHTSGKTKPKPSTTKCVLNQIKQATVYTNHLIISSTLTTEQKSSSRNEKLGKKSNIKMKRKRNNSRKKRIGIVNLQLHAIGWNALLLKRNTANKWVASWTATNYTYVREL